MTAKGLALVCTLLVSPATATSCNSTACEAREDEMSLVQIDQHVRKGRETDKIATVSKYASDDSKESGSLVSKSKETSWTEMLRNEIVFELSGSNSTDASNGTGGSNDTNSSGNSTNSTATGPMKNKLIMGCLEIFIVAGLCGIDRCYMGQICLGVLKGITLGGLGFWALMDYVNFLINSLMEEKSIHMLGLNATWEDWSVTPSWYLSLAFLILWICMCLSALCFGTATKIQRNKQDEDPIYDDY